MGASGGCLAVAKLGALLRRTRLGRKTRLSAVQRKVLWRIFERVRTGLKSRNPHDVPRAVYRACGCDRQKDRTARFRGRR
jgi:hypothetical protein